jgi:uncharacterized repeat protein (TIGR03847 family)
MGDDLDAERIQVEAIGEPGQRRFRLLAIVKGQTYAVWMEKQQIQALGLALEQMLEQLPDAGPVVPEPPGVTEFDRETRKQFRVGRMELGYDDDADRIVVVAHDLNSPEESDVAFACRMTRAQARDLSAESAAVAAAGRPRCTMCGAPMGPGSHVCPQQNGHLRHELEEEEEEDELGDEEAP